VQERSVIERMQILEQKVATLEGLPARVNAVELQILHLRDEIRVDFSATREQLRTEIRASGDALRTEMRAMAGGLRGEMQTIDAGLRGEMQAIEAGLRGEMQAIEAGLRGEMSAVHQELVALITHTTQETRREMRVLYEDLKSTIKALGEGGTFAAG